MLFRWIVERVHIRRSRQPTGGGARFEPLPLSNQSLQLLLVLANLTDGPDCPNPYRQAITCFKNTQGEPERPQFVCDLSQLIELISLKVLLCMFQIPRPSRLLSLTRFRSTLTVCTQRCASSRNQTRWHYCSTHYCTRTATWGRTYCPARTWRTWWDHVHSAPVHMHFIVLIERMHSFKCSCKLLTAVIIHCGQDFLDRDVCFFFFFFVGWYLAFLIIGHYIFLFGQCVRRSYIIRTIEQRVKQISIITSAVKRLIVIIASKIKVFVCIIYVCVLCIFIMYI